MKTFVSSKPNDSSHQPNDDNDMKAIIEEVHIFSKKLSESPNFNDDSILTQHSICLTEKPLQKAQQKCAAMSDESF